MKVLILCGGRGLRMHELTRDMPKPLVPIAGKPMLWHIMKLYKHYGFDDFILLLGYRGDRIKEYFMDYPWKNHSFVLDTQNSRITLLEEAENWKITFLDTGLDTTTGDRIKKARDLVGNETFMATYGDGLADINLHKLLAFHREKGRIATVTGISKKSQYGTMTVRNGIADSFVEKESREGIINGGFFVFEPGVFDYLSAVEPNILEKHAMADLARDRQLAVYMHDGFWYACDTYYDVMTMNKMAEEGMDRWRVWK